MTGQNSRTCDASHVHRTLQTRLACCIRVWRSDGKLVWGTSRIIFYLRIHVFVIATAPFCSAAFSARERAYCLTHLCMRAWRCRIRSHRVPCCTPHSHSSGKGGRHGRYISSGDDCLYIPVHYSHDQITAKTANAGPVRSGLGLH